MRIQDRYRLLSWAFRPSTDRAEVDVEFTPRDGGTHVVVTSRGDSGDWPGPLDDLRAFVEGGEAE